MTLNYRIIIGALTLILCFNSNFVRGQEVRMDSLTLNNCIPEFDKLDGQLAYSNIVNLAHFPGGEEKLFKYIASHIRFPAADPEWHGKVIVTFIIDTKGFIRNDCISNQVPSSVEFEVHRLLKNMPRWKPGIKNGKKVYTRFWLPIIFEPAE